MYMGNVSCESQKSMRFSIAPQVIYAEIQYLKLFWPTIRMLCVQALKDELAKIQKSGTPHQGKNPSNKENEAAN